MEINEYLKMKKDLYNALFNFLEYESDSQNDYKILINILEIEKLHKNREDFKELLQLISKMAKNHHRQPNFVNKIEKIILFLKEDIKQTFSNSEIFDIFKNNRLMTLFLYEQQILIMDKTILYFIYQKFPNSKTNKFLQSKFFHYFYPEFKASLDKDTKELIEKDFNDDILNNFKEKRRIGENESEICSLIRNDDVDKFSTYINRTNTSLSSRIKPSIFETNSFLINEEPSLIEYAAFSGSIQIFQYLMSNKIELTSPLWTYSVHSDNIDLFNLLDDNIDIKDDSIYENCLKEAIKCHHNDIAKYLKEKLNGKISEEKNFEENFDNNFLSYSFHYHNYTFLPTEINTKLIFYYACQYNYFTLVNFLLKTKELKINETVIPNIYKFK